ncbi:MAG: iron (metal) dependent repressor, dtxr family protein [Crocinitomicaceae bacterium]|nr:iron (metal) dependent repressor, dtxr family protein [Crocinitomicaceae bacterium]|tara:strand:+ start:13809 stop:14465 length:657 start_codon:yes stop_codon:yes gene_type:complete
MASQTKENYIKAIYFLHQKSEAISLSDLGQELGVSKPTANDMIKKLKADGIVISEKYKPIKITEKGKRVAASIIRKHRLSEMFLSQIMEFGWEEVHEIAEELEHLKIEKFFDRMDEILGFPTTDPHGSPIPDKNGNFNKPNYLPFSQVSEGSTVVVKALRESSMDFLIFLNKKAIQLGTEMKVEQVESFDGSYTVSFGDFTNVVLGKTVCDRLLVEVV